MNASSKPVLGHPLQGMHQIQSKIFDLQTQYERLLKERQQAITTLITNLDLAALEDHLLMGGLLFVKDKTTTKDPIMEVWRDAGEKFLRRTKPRNSSRISPQKSAYPKQTSTPQAKHQSSQTHPQSGEA